MLLFAKAERLIWPETRDSQRTSVPPHTHFELRLILFSR